MDVYQRQMRQKLAEKKLRMCRKCGSVLDRGSDCPCKDDPTRYPSVVEVAKRENPRLANALARIADRKSLPTP